MHLADVAYYMITTVYQQRRLIAAKMHVESVNRLLVDRVASDYDTTVLRNIQTQLAQAMLECNLLLGAIEQTEA